MASVVDVNALPRDGFDGAVGLFDSAGSRQPSCLFAIIGSRCIYCPQWFRCMPFQDAIGCCCESAGAGSGLRREERDCSQGWRNSGALFNCGRCDELVDESCLGAELTRTLGASARTTCVCG